MLTGFVFLRDHNPCPLASCSRHLHPGQFVSARTVSNRRFNLVELILVLTVLVSLAALLLPVFYRSGLNAKSILCSQNQDRIGKWIKLYCNDADGLLPAYEDGWVQALSGLGEQEFAEGGMPAGAFACPSQGVDSLEDGISASEFWRGSHYGINQHISSRITDKYGNTYEAFAQASIRRMQAPSRKALLADASGGNFFGFPDRDNTITGFSIEGGTYADVIPPSRVRAYPYLRHLDATSNFLFVDGHVAVKKTWPVFMSGRGSSGFDFWFAEHTPGEKPYVAETRKKAEEADAAEK
jgi:prepilin-type processing-associated H-X9-DG protein